MVNLRDVVNYCDQRIHRDEVSDFEGAFNGLQLENNGEISKICASVDAGLVPFRLAIEKKADFLVCHHGMYWTPPNPLTGSNYEKIKLCIDANLALYGCHLPLDCHPEIGNNALLANKLGLEPCGSFLPFEGVDIGLITTSSYDRKELVERLTDLFPKGFHAMEFGMGKPEKIAILTGSGQSAVDQILAQGADTLLTGELKQHHFNFAQEMELNLYACGHYATECFGVDALAREVAQKFDIPYEFIATDCPL
jgi:dinuclear metal center YbgI/SA1388 family protein